MRTKIDNIICIERSIKAHGNKYLYNLVNYTGNHKTIKIICPAHGIFNQNPSTHLRGSGCSLCADEKLKLGKNKFELRANIIHNNKYNYSLFIYVNSYTKGIIICQKHGNFEQTPNSHLCGCGCPQCSIFISKSEIQWLNSLNIPMDYRQHIIKIGNSKYKVDAYNPITNTVYEFYGDYWHGNPQVYDLFEINNTINKTFGELYNKTMQKENILMSNGYKLITMWENNFKLQGDDNDL